MRKLWELLAQREQAGDFGIEIEVEGRGLPELAGNRYWRTEEDNSLRNGGREYVFKKPLGIQYIHAVLRNLVSEFEKAEAAPEFSFRTSVHVHMNMQQLEVPHIFNTIYTYLLLEGVLMNFCGDSRKANRFCLRAQDAEYLMDVLTDLFRRGDGGLRDIPNNFVRYSAINIEALLKYGSLEFRAMQGNMDVERIFSWCKGLGNIRTFACKFKNPAEIYNHYIRLEAQAFFEEVMQEMSPVFTCPELVREIQQSFSLSIDLPFSYVAHKENDSPAPIKAPRIKLRPLMEHHDFVPLVINPEPLIGNP